VEGVGQKTAETLLEKAKAHAALAEEEYLKQKAKEVEAAAGQKDGGKEEKLRAEDVFEEDEDFVTEADDQQVATAPGLDEELEGEAIED